MQGLAVKRLSMHDMVRYTSLAYNVFVSLVHRLPFPIQVEQSRREATKRMLRPTGTFKNALLSIGAHYSG
jgi:hypothetical protein